MSTTPVFDRVFRNQNFKALPTEYTDRFTPEVARQQGYRHGYNQALDTVATIIRSQGKLTKSMQTLLDQVIDLEVID